MPIGRPWMVHRRDLVVSSASNVHMVALGVGPGLFGIEWDWPRAISAPKAEQFAGGAPSTTDQLSHRAVL
jgi:hypothetical protein